MNKTDFLDEKLKGIEETNDQMKELRKLAGKLKKVINDDHENKLLVNSCMHLLDDDQIKKINEMIHKQVAIKLNDLDKNRTEMIQQVNKKFSK